MSPGTIATRIAAAVPILSIAAAGTLAAQAAVRPVFSHALPPLDGRHVEVRIVEVSYGPGQSSPPHSHPCAVVGYVLDGAVRMQVEGERDSVYRAGESFYEAPNGVHLVSANASATAPTRFLAWFTCDRATPLTVPVTVPVRDTAGRSRR